MTSISLKIPDELASRLDAAALAQRTSRSAIIREALEEKLESLARDNRPSLLEQSLDLCGSGASDIGDLSSNPDHSLDFGKRSQS
ncbi:ribbon-helix-helix domain-containing protein [Luteolibacter flavescens]|uniref:Ribbon-helix-helix domain-containing protein n=1 Tax=Luteolibacter flavescens TaxID=1859460 RepID=A0ABT3FSV6_9BACT|nr:ribbon-helix-helix domain-containing protein [Luteolibacter flavescens]MCW1886635.1 ribbon-helix-helix domain-containing protein [Luteolibacter flavescens]